MLLSEEERKTEYHIIMNNMRTYVVEGGSHPASLAIITRKKNGARVDNFFKHLIRQASRVV